MTGPDDATVVTARLDMVSELVPSLEVRRRGRGEYAPGARVDLVEIRVAHLERARKLGLRIDVKVAVDDTGWLRGDVELEITKEQDGTIRLVSMRISPGTSDDDVLGEDGVLERCGRYNSAIGQLRQLAARLAQLADDQNLKLDPGSQAEYAHRWLARLDELIARRQRSTMGMGRVRRSTLGREIEFWSRCDANLTPIILEAERTASGPRRSARRWWRR